MYTQRGTDNLYTTWKYAVLKAVLLHRGHYSSAYLPYSVEQVSLITVAVKHPGSPHKQLCAVAEPPDGAASLGHISNSVSTDIA